MKSAAEINNLFGSAEAAYAKGDGATALALIAQIEPFIDPHSGLLHLKGLVQIQTGNMQAARISLASALRLTPNDIQIGNNFANLLFDLGEFDEALILYDATLKDQPHFTEALLNRAISLHKLGRYDDSRADFGKLVSLIPNTARLWSAKGAMEYEFGSWDIARSDFMKSIAIDPRNIVALAGLGKIALELGEPQSTAFYQAAYEQNKQNLSLIIGLTYSRFQNGDPNATDVLRRYLTDNPSWQQGHEVYAEIRYEQGGIDECTDLFHAAVMDEPQNDELRLSLCKVHAGKDDYAEAVKILFDRPKHMAKSKNISMVTVSLALALGDDSLATQAFAELPEDDVATWCDRARFQLKQGDLEQAETILSKLRTAQPNNIAAWAYSDIAWRACNDERHYWLHGQSGLVKEQELELDFAELLEITEYLRQLHISSSAPFGQSLRSGTQTRGRLFRRNHPAIAKLKSAIETAIRVHWQAMPDIDPKHPLLQHRFKTPVIDGSWSIRLTENGFHVHHFHPQGLLSSACYLVVPDECNDAEYKPGWLELGRAPKELGIDLDPLVSIQPVPGKIVLFPSTLFHGTRKFAAGERLTVAFDVQV